MLEWIIGYIVLALLCGTARWFWALSFITGVFAGLYGIIISLLNSELLMALIYTVPVLICSWLIWAMVELSGNS